jgi:hypothetical protein
LPGPEALEAQGKEFATEVASSLIDQQQNSSDSEDKTNNNYLLRAT